MPLPLRRTVATLGALGLAALATPAALAHDVVLGGNPADGETVEQFPEEVVLEFSGIPKEGFNTLAVSAADSGEVLFTGEPTVEGRNVSLRVPQEVDAGPGEYRIGFQITSSDGHSTRGMTTFTVAGDAAATQPQDAPAEGTDGASRPEQVDETGMSAGAKIAVAAVAVLALAAAAVAAVAKSRRRDNLRGTLDEQ
ncbi:copper resistance CopC family protein [Corynebacterium guangdongense]|uniref:Methionine-rich copper-binding protein CopC n=1 Tax=Corynebacterium guangdongense TaxID=1783348 RepID=A0ABU1ZX13_9CORY|nr:copper resistance CopC family protein [Corynebacterium guangdongense]MDR7329476.1 methionine-rich copper-binding protein CopC [Corynebacterium guangdongense]WJZ18041.1 hypothetical protein CGUA_07360 [Corynebacterium guangdongense]